ncbi:MULTISPECIES: hypothetical protein [Streptomyces]
MSFFALYDAEHFYGEPEPVPGARVSFAPDKLFAVLVVGFILLVMYGG